MALYEIIDLFVESGFTDESQSVKDFVNDLQNNPGSYLITNEIVFYAIRKCRYLKTLINALYNAKRYTGESPVIQKRLLKLQQQRERIVSVEDQMEWLCDMLDLMNEVKDKQLRVSNVSMDYAMKYFGEFETFMSTLEENHIDMPVYNFQSMTC